MQVDHIFEGSRLQMQVDRVPAIATRCRSIGTLQKQKRIWLCDQSEKCNLLSIKRTIDRSVAQYI